MLMLSSEIITIPPSVIEAAAALKEQFVPISRVHNSPSKTRVNFKGKIVKVNIIIIILYYSNMQYTLLKPNIVQLNLIMNLRLN